MFVVRRIIVLGLFVALGCQADKATTPETPEVQTGEAANAQPVDYQALMDLEPRPTRAGHLRFQSKLVQSPGAAVVFLERLAAGDESPDVRAALVEALPRTTGTFTRELMELYSRENHASVRVAMMHAARRSPLGLELIAAGFADGNHRVRTEAAIAAGRHAYGADLETQLLGALGDEAPAVVAAAVRSMRVLGQTGLQERLPGLLQHDSADVRLQSLRAAQHFGNADFDLDALERDSDARVRRVAERLKR